MQRYTDRGSREADGGGEFDGGFGEIGIDGGCCRWKIKYITRINKQFLLCTTKENLDSSVESTFGAQNERWLQEKRLKVC